VHHKHNVRLWLARGVCRFMRNMIGLWDGGIEEELEGEMTCEPAGHGEIAITANLRGGVSKGSRTYIMRTYPYPRNNPENRHDDN